mgnify:CR=1 FL=1
MNAFVEKVFAAGVVGCGGAGLPTHVKLAKQADWFIVNAAECEPLLRTDRHVMLAHAEELVETTAAMAAHLGRGTGGYRPEKDLCQGDRPARGGDRAPVVRGSASSSR